MEWWEIDEAQKTWRRFKTHFTAAHKALRKVRGKTIRQTSYFQANQVLEQVNHNINQMKADILDSMSTFHQSAATPYDTTSFTTPTTLPTQASFVTTSTVSNDELLKLIQQLQPQLAKRTTNTTNTKKPTKRVVKHYCWTHGACGHQDNATFQNKMGCSVYYCRVAADQMANANGNE